jgi:hypothetical protein
MPTSKLENVKDLFVFGSFVGLRFSDYSDVRPEHIIKDDGELFLKVKTKNRCDIVYSLPSGYITGFEKYQNTPNRLPKSISNQSSTSILKRPTRLPA